MSRCFPYPPPGYIPSDAVIELKARLPTEKNKRKEKREKRREKRRRVSKSEESSLSEERGRPEISGGGIRPISGGTSMSMSDAVLNIPRQGVELQYQCLLANLFPPPLEDASVLPVDSDWLQSDGSFCSRTSALGTTPVYALPFVVPY